MADNNYKLGPPKNVLTMKKENIISKIITQL